MLRTCKLCGRFVEVFYLDAHEEWRRTSHPSEPSRFAVVKRYPGWRFSFHRGADLKGCANTWRLLAVQPPRPEAAP